MGRTVLLFSVLLYIGFVSSAISKQPNTDHKSRVIDDDLSKSPHEVDGSHNPSYDREALFGDQASDLEDLPPDELRIKIGKIFDKMDLDHDGHVTSEELLKWLRAMHETVSLGDVKRIWKDHGLQPTDKITWEQYKTHALSPDGEYEGEDEQTQQSFIERDKRRWEAVDKDHTGALSMTQATAFFNPEAHPEMHDLLVKETIEELDKNKDGFIDVNEYVDDLWKKSDGQEEEPEWVKSEREEFSQQRDTNHDGKMDASEVKNWIFPAGYDHSEAEVKHLLSECDKDKDGRLSKEEMQNRHDLLASSVATNYGEIFSEHDEL